MPQFDVERLKQYPLYKDVEWVVPVSKYTSDMPEYVDYSDYLAKLAQDMVPGLPMSGLTNLRGPQVGGPLGSSVRTKLIGNPDAVQQHGTVVFRSASGWRYRRSAYREARRTYRPVEIKVGDCLSHETAGTPVNTWVRAGNHADRTERSRMYYTSMTYNVAGAFRDSSAWSTVRFANTFGNGHYTDVCLPTFRTDSVGTLDLGPVVSNWPINIADIFKRTSASDRGPNEFGTGAYALKHYGNWNTDSTLPEYSTDPNSFYYEQSFVSLETEFRVYNPSNQSMTVELYCCAPKSVTEWSPMGDYDAIALDQMELSSNWDDGPNNRFMVGSGPEKVSAWRKNWKFQKRIVTIVPSSSVVVKLRTPLSLIRNEVVMRLKGTQDTSCSIPGLTQWLWMRAYGVNGYDTFKNTGGFGRATLAVQMYQKLRCLYSQPNIVKRINIIRCNTDITPDEDVAVDDQPTA